MIINSKNLKDFQFTLDTEFAAAMDDAIPDDNSLAKALFYEKTALRRKKVQYPWVSAAPRVQKVKKGEPQEKQVLPLNSLTIEAGKASLLLGIDEFDLECDEEGLYIDMIRDNGSVMADFYETRAAALVTGGFTTVHADGGGKNFFDENRVVSPDLGANSATYTNKIVDVLGGTGFVKARKYLRQMTDGKGKPRGLGNRGFFLVCGTENEDAARDLLLLEKTTGGKSNPYYKAADLIISSYFGASTVWALGCYRGKAAGKPLIKQINAPWRSRMTGTEDISAIVEGEILYQTHMRGEESYGDPQLLIGSTGAGA